MYTESRRDAEERRRRAEHLSPIRLETLPCKNPPPPEQRRTHARAPVRASPFFPSNAPCRAGLVARALTRRPLLSLSAMRGPTSSPSTPRGARAAPAAARPVRPRAPRGVELVMYWNSDPTRGVGAGGAAQIHPQRRPPSSRARRASGSYDDTVPMTRTERSWSASRDARVGERVDRAVADHPARAPGRRRAGG